MSLVLATKAALLSRLSASVVLKQNLAPNPNNPFVPAIWEGTLSTATPVYPCVTFRIPENRPDARFRPTAAEGGGTSPIQNLVVEMEIFDDRQDSSVRIEQIADAVYFEMDGKTLDLTDTSCGCPLSGRGFHCANEYRSGPLWDPAHKNRFVLLRFRLALQRTL